MAYDDESYERGRWGSKPSYKYEAGSPGRRGAEQREREEKERADNLSWQRSVSAQNRRESNERGNTQSKSGGTSSTVVMGLLVLLAASFFGSDKADRPVQPNVAPPQQKMDGRPVLLSNGVWVGEGVEKTINLNDLGSLQETIDKEEFDRIKYIIGYANFYGGYYIPENVKRDLNKIIKILKNNPDIKAKFIVRGYDIVAASTRTSADVQARRSYIVKKYVISKGIGENRVSNGWGEIEGRSRSVDVIFTK